VNRILVLDDDPTFGRLVQTVCRLEGYQAEVVPSPEALLPLAREIKPALVLMDVHYSRRDMLEVLRALREDDTLRDLPVVMTSGMDRRHECLEAGADAFLMKPFNPTELLKIIAHFARREDGPDVPA